ncbi:MAG: DMT family transporter [Burkholderiales bacterium]|nr:DMT family transporter [Burkholderiales bacterium]
MQAQWAYLLLALIIGAGVAVQAGINTQLRGYVGHAAFAALASFSIGTLGLLAFSLTLREPWPSFDMMRSGPAWVWLGGLLGAFYVAFAVVIAPKLGAATMFALIIAGQVMMSLLLDHYGWIGFSSHPINAWRVVGALLLIAGVAMVVRN